MNSTYVKHTALVRDLDAALEFVNDHRHEFPFPKISINVGESFIASYAGSGSVDVTVEGYTRTST